MLQQNLRVYNLTCITHEIFTIACNLITCNCNLHFHHFSPMCIYIYVSICPVEVIFLRITSAFQPSIHALAWPLALAVCFSRSAVAWSQRFDTAEGPTPPGHAVAARPGPVGARPERPERSKLRQNKVVEKSSSAKVLGGWLYNVV